MKKSLLIIAIVSLLAAGLYLLPSRVEPVHAAWTEPSWIPELRSSPVTPPPVTGTTFYVANNGLDANPGTLAQPWLTIRKAMATLTAGQMAYIRGGTYNEGNFTPAHSGSPGNYIIFRAYPGETPKINCAGNGFCIWEYGTQDVNSNFVPGSTRSYMVFDGLEMYGPNRGISTCVGQSGCNHIWFVNSTFHDTGSGENALAFWSSDGTDQHIVVSNNKFYNIRKAGVLSSYASDELIEFNEIWNSGYDEDDGGLIGPHRGWHLIIRYNKVHDNQRDPASPVACYSSTYCQGITGIYCDTCTDAAKGTRTYIYNNLSYNNDAGLQIYNSTNVTAFNNVIYHNGFTPGYGRFIYMFGKGIFLGSSQGIDLENNLIYGNRNAGIDFSISQGSTTKTRNNIVMNNGGTEMYIDPFNNTSTSYDTDYDLMKDDVNIGTTFISWGTNYSSLADFRTRSGKNMWANAKEATALFVNAAGGDFHPLAGSPAVNAGTPALFFNFDFDNNTRPAGATWDIGPYEYTVSTQPPTLTLSSSPTTITMGQSSTLTWSSSNASSCSASGGWSGTQLLTGSQIVSPSTTTTYTLTCTGAGGSVTQSAIVSVSPPTIPAVHAIPGRIEAENYLVGGEGVGYHDTTPGNTGGAYRNDDVDIKDVPGEGYTIGWTANGEWLAYTISTTQAGIYQANLRVANGGTTNTSAHLELDGVNVTGAIAIVPTAGWSTQATIVSPSFAITQGTHTLKVVFDVTPFDLNWIDMAFVSPLSVGNLTFTPSVEGKTTIPSNTSFTLSFYTPATSTLKATAVMTTDTTGKLTFPVSVSLAPGNYDILIVTTNYLKKKQLNVSLVSNATLSLAQLTSGDFNNDNVINALDWSVMNANWFANTPITDINGDGITNSLDFSYLNANWNKVGD